ncbi:MAG: prolyl-tRNA synthetase associated domain-containing protein [Clostridia bacterium]|nr:prolyl-tRNA synthetase associated domain-containing protein [Clostridia bacterium]
MKISDRFFTSASERGACIEKERKVYEFLESNNIPFAGLTHDEAATIALCEEIEQKLGAEICKNLFLCNAQKTAFYLLIMPGRKVFKTKFLSKQIGSARLSFADAEHMEKFLNVTPGSVSALGLLFDTERQVRFLIDNDLLTQETIGFHPCINTSTVKIRLSDLSERFLPALDVEPTFVELPTEF